MSDSTTRNCTPVTARSSIVASESATLANLSSTSHRSTTHAKLRLRIVTRPPLPEHRFLAPFEPNVPKCFAKLKSFVHKYLVDKSEKAGQNVALVESIHVHALEFQMDNFDVPDDPEILRDGDTLEVVIDADVEIRDTGFDEHARIEIADQSRDQRQHDANEGEQQDRDLDSLQLEAQNAEERDAIVQATRVAALLRAGVHNMTDGHDDLASKHIVVDDLPRMPRPPTLASTKSTSPKASSSNPFSAPSLPPMPTSLVFGGAASAMAAFEAKRKQMQASSQSSFALCPSDRIGSVANANASASASASAKRVGKRPRSSSPSSSSESSSDSCSTSESDSDSCSDSCSSSESDSDSCSDDTGSTDSGSESDSESCNLSCDSSTSSSDSAPSEQPTRYDRPRTWSTSPRAVPPGQGLNRTKRRNAMRRHKLKMLRDAENVVQFENARRRAELAQGGVDHVGPVGWVEDREGTMQIEHVSDRSRVHDSALISVKDEMPPGSGTFGMDVFSAARDSNVAQSKRKRQEELTPSSVDDAAAHLASRWQDRQSSDPMHGVQVPYNVHIRHVDCQAYYDSQLAVLQDVLQGEAEAVGRVVRSSRRRKKTLDDEQAESENADLDYSSVEGEMQDRGRPKRIKIESVTPRIGSSPVGAAESSTIRFGAPAPLGERSDMDIERTWLQLKQTYHPSDIACCTRIDASTVDLAHLEPGFGLIWQALALHPLRQTPEIMWHVGIVSSTSPHIQLHSLGPLHESRSTHWHHYEPVEMVWQNPPSPVLYRFA